MNMNQNGCKNIIEITKLLHTKHLKTHILEVKPNMT